MRKVLLVVKVRVFGYDDLLQHMRDVVCGIGELALDTCAAQVHLLALEAFPARPNDRLTRTAIALMHRVTSK
jgi:hypothetical protein